MSSFCYKSLILFLFALSTSLSVYGQGKVAGKIIDKNTGEAIIGANITVKDANTGAASDLDGNYFLQLPAGTYTILIEYLGYQPVELTNVAVKDKETTYQDAVMSEAAEQLQEVVVQGEIRRETADAVLAQQKNAISVTSGISSEQFRRLPDRTTGDVLKRVSGASIQDNKYAVIRGLNDRYNMAFLNGAPLPSTESDRKAFSFDLIPSALLDNMTINKTATPDMPADFAGGIININTKDIPAENSQSIQIAGGYNGLTTFKNFNKAEGSKTDFLGFDNGFRKLPDDALPTDQAKKASLADIANQSKLFNNNNFGAQNKNARINIGLQYSFNRRFKIKENDLGVIFALTYNNNLRYVPFESYALTSEGKQSYKNDSYRTNIAAGSILNFSYKIGQNNKFFIKNLVNLTTDNNYTERAGNLRESAQTAMDLYRYQAFSTFYQSSKMLSSQAGGEHVIGGRQIKVKYNFGYTKIYREVPGYKILTYESRYNEEDQVYSPFSSTSIVAGQNTGSFANLPGRYFSYLNESSYSAKYEVGIPINLFEKTEIKVGGLNIYRQRDFNARIYNYFYNPNTFKDYSKLSLGPDEIFADENIGANGFMLKESTRPSDRYKVSSNLTSGFLMLDNKINPWIRFIYGIRFEKYVQNVETPVNTNDITKIKSTTIDPLPSANLILSISKNQNLRLSYSKTLNRPEFRELTNLQFYDFSQQSLVYGSPTLTRALIFNYDLKYEFFPSAGQTISINPFYKRFNNPIEMMREAGASFLTFGYSNQKSATSYGIEFEVRKNGSELDRVFNTTFFENLTVYANYAIIKSSVEIEDLNTNLKSRPLQGQSPYVINAGIQYSSKTLFDLGLAVNRIGRRISLAANDPTFLIWENPRTVVDFNVSKTFFKKLQVRYIIGDILAQNQTFYNDFNLNGKYDAQDFTIFKYRLAPSHTLGVSYRF